jgi:hypothetical protein
VIDHAQIYSLYEFGYPASDTNAIRILNPNLLLSFAFFLVSQYKNIPQKIPNRFNPA